MKTSLHSLLSIGVVVLGLAACGGEPPAEPPATTQAAPTTQAAAPAEVEAPSETGEFGVEECDDFFTKYFACIDSSVPDEARAAVQQAAEQTKTQLQQAAGQPNGKEGLAMACTQAEEAAKQALQAYGCDW